MKRNFFMLLVFTLLSFCLVGCGKTAKEKMGEPEIRPIKSCVLSSEVESYAHGAFVLGVGTYSSGSETHIDYYLYIKGVEGFRLQKLDFNKVEIVETDEVEPSIKGYFSETGKIYASPDDIEIFDWVHDDYSEFNEYTNYTLYVPTGTIKAEFNADVNQILE